jgi:phosphoribosylformylglycinamidine cyclo-ligase
MGLGINDVLPEIGRTVADELLTPTRIYVKSILNLLRDFTIHGIAHITGGGLPENVPRILPKGCMARIRTDAWEMPAIFSVIQQGGNIAAAELYRTFNCGIGMVLAVSAAEAEDVLQRLKALGETAMIIGQIVRCEPGREGVELVA